MNKESCPDSRPPVCLATEAANKGEHPYRTVPSYRTALLPHKRQSQVSAQSVRADRQTFTGAQVVSGVGSTVLVGPCVSVCGRRIPLAADCDILVTRNPFSPCRQNDRTSSLRMLTSLALDSLHLRLFFLGLLATVQPSERIHGQLCLQQRRVSSEEPPVAFW